MVARERTLVVKVTDEELNMLHRLADDADDTIAKVVRRWIRDAYVERHGLQRPPAARLKHGK